MPFSFSSQRMAFFWALLIGCSWSGFLHAAEPELDLITIKETHWGFDNMIPKNTFLPLSILVQNTSPSTSTITLELTRRIGIEKTVGTVLQQEVTLAAESERWVQFAPFVEDELENWHLSWGPDKNHQMDLPQTNVGRRATVLIYDRTAVTPPPGPLRRLPEEIFPTTVAATKGLRGVVLDYSPRWQGARARAFLDWLQSGGRVYLLKSDDGTFPQFPVPFEVLNQADDEFRVGLGTVKRIPRTVAEIDLRFAAVTLFNDDQQTVRNANNPLFTLGRMSAMVYDRNYNLITNLVALARFKRNWLLIYLSVFAYLLTLWPGCYRIGRLAKDYRWFYAAFFGAIVLFSLLFISLGQLGTMIQNRIRGLAVARHLGDGAYHVHQWSTIAVPRGGTYRWQLPGTGICVQNNHEFEAVQGAFQVGTEAWAEFFMAPSATRTFIHESRLSTSRTAPIVNRFERADLGGPILEIDGTNAFSESPEGALLYYNGTIYKLEVQGKMLKMPARATGSTIATFFDNLDQQQGLGLLLRTLPAEEDIETMNDRELYRRSMNPLLTFALDLGEDAESDLPHHMARVLVIARMPPEFFPDTNTFPDQSGRVVYCYDIPLE